MRIWGKINVLFFLLLVALPARGRVFLQWSESSIPSAVAMGVKDIAVPWGPGKNQLMNAARDQGYRVFAEVDAKDAIAAADAAVANRLAGIIVEGKSDEPGRRATSELVRKLQSSHPKLSILDLDPGGKQPQIRGSEVVKRNGVLVVSSPTRQPWIDSNVALERFERAYQPDQVPLFSFTWDLTDPLEQKEGPRFPAYALAVAEAGAMRADVILPIHQNLQKGLANGDKTAWAEWDQVKPYLRFYSEDKGARRVAWSDVAIVSNNYDDAYEAMNLLSRHNIPFRVLAPAGVTPQGLRGSRLVIVFSKPDGSAARALQSFSASGGTVLLVDQKGPFPWSTMPAAKVNGGASYKVGGGEIIELAEPVGDPEAFAEQVRSLLNKHGVLIYLWNALTTLGFPYLDSGSKNMVLELVNYAQEPLEVQVRVKGRFSNIRYVTPEHGPYPAIQPEHDDGFTEFVVPSLMIGGRVYLSREEPAHK